jgi:AraC family transcriptional regulator
VIKIHTYSSILFTAKQIQEDRMKRRYDLLNNVLTDIEKGIRTDINSDVIARKHTISEGHLQRLFRSAYNQPIGLYIRSFKLTASINDLLNTDSNILDIALEYGFNYEQSYIRAFKRKFGITPGKLRKKGKYELMVNNG